MSASRTDLLKRILAEATALPIADRPAYLRQECGADASLREEAEELLAHRDAAGSFLDPPAQSMRGDLTGTTLVGRYRIGEVLGSGGFGRVYQATDLLSNKPVAVKVFRESFDRYSPEIRRETATLRWLRLPGVVQLLDEGAAEGRAFVVMELVDGTPFPGTDSREWAAMQETALALLETIARIHWAGVIHCDLKPNNVLVRADGVPIVLDLGLSGGPALEGGLAVGAEFAGTPRYAAPERFYGASPGVRADLYAFGLMLFEALAGEPPPQEPGSPVALRPAGGRVPVVVADLVERLTSPVPESRPASAEEALAILRGLPGEPDLPWLGDPAPVEQLVRAGLEGRGCGVAGADGSGRSRCLREVERRLASRGVAARRPVAAQRPFASLEPVLGLPRLAAGLDDAHREIADRLGALLADGVVLLVEDTGALDPWSARVVEDAAERGAVLIARGTPRPGDAALGPIGTAELRRLFEGPDRVLHLREDAAHELWRRTQGWPAAIAREVGAWVRSGLARREGNRLVVTRAALEQLRLGVVTATARGASAAEEPLEAPGELEDVLLCVEIARGCATPALIGKATGSPPWLVEAWLGELAKRELIRARPGGGFDPSGRRAGPAGWPPEKLQRLHGLVADALPPRTLERLQHLLAARRLDEVVAETPAVAEELLVTGRVWAAWMLLLEGLRLLHATGASERDGAFLPPLLLCGLAEGTSTSLDVVIYYCARSRVSSRALLAIEGIARAAQLVLQGDGARALAMLQADTPAGDPLLARARHSVRTIAASTEDPAVHARVTDEACLWARSVDDPSVRALALEWQGWLRYHERRYEEAAQLHEEAARTTRETHKRIAGLLNSAWALLEAHHPDRARGLAHRASRLAAECRHAHYEARAEMLRRAADYRAGDHGEPDLELVEAIEAVAAPRTHAVALLNEAAAAWRAGQHGVGRLLASRAAERFHGAAIDCGVALARALSLACGGSEDPVDIERLAVTCATPGLRLQALGLLAHAGHRPSPQAVGCARSDREQLDSVHDRARREVVSPSEAWSWVVGG